MNERYWKNFYLRSGAPTEPSAFAQFCDEYIISGSTLLDVGAGNGRDSRFFARHCQVTKIDPVYNLTLEKFVQKFPFVRYDYVYARFFLHAVPERTENLLLTWARLAAKRKLFLEMRSIRDRAFEPDHDRRLIDPGKIFKKLLATGYRIEYFKEARGLAVFEDHDKRWDPVVIRIIASNEGKI